MQIVKNPRTEADVDLLTKVFPDLLPDGRTIAHEQLEAVLKMTRAQSRYRTVVSRWRRRLFVERRVFLDGRAAEGQGFVALTPDQMVRFANRAVRAAGRQIKKALAVASAPNDEELSADVLRYRNLLQAAALRIAEHHQAEIRDIGKALRPMAQLPRASNQ